jgi:hypothetical protein
MHNWPHPTRPFEGINTAKLSEGKFVTEITDGPFYEGFDVVWEIP